MSIRISVASLVSKIINSETGERAWCALANKGSWTKKKELLFTAIAGGTLAWPAGESLLKTSFKADFTGAEREDGGIDLRFHIPENFVEEVISLMVFPDPQLFESPLACIQREVIGELTTAEIAGLQDQPILTPEQAAQISFVPLRGYRQPLPEDGVGSSANSAAVRYFYMFDMVVSSDVWETLKASPIIRFFTEAQVKLTNGGRKKAIIEETDEHGASRTITLGDNVFYLPE